MATAPNYLILDKCSHIQTGDESSMTINVTIPGSHNTIYLVNPNCVNVGGHHNTVINQTDNSEVTEVEEGSCHDDDDDDDDYVFVSGSEQERCAGDTELVQREEGGGVADIYETTNTTHTQSLTSFLENITTAFQNQLMGVGSPVEARVQGTNRRRRLPWLLALFRPVFHDVDVVDRRGKPVRIGDNVWIKRRGKSPCCSAIYVGDGHVIVQVKGEDKVRKVSLEDEEFYVVLIRSQKSKEFSRAELVKRSENRLNMSYSDDQHFVKDVFGCHTWDM